MVNKQIDIHYDGVYCGFPLRKLHDLAIRVLFHTHVSIIIIIWTNWSDDSYITSFSKSGTNNE